MIARHARSFASLCIAASAWCVATAALGAPNAMTLRVDATDLPRNLVHARAEMDVEPGPLELRYVTWVPGNHGPSGPIRNVAGFDVTDQNGRQLRWDRDPTAVDRITVQVGANVERIAVDVTYIASQPTTNSRSSDTYGRPNFGGLNWNTIIFYPAETHHTDLMVEPSIVLPEGWYPATALDFEAGADGAWRFETVPLATLVDCPVIFGTPDADGVEGNLKTYPLIIPDAPEHYMHIVAADPEDAALPDFLLPKYERMVRECIRIFSGFPRDEYHFLIMLGDDLRFGLEHSTSTYIGSRADAFSSAEETAFRGGGGGMTVIPHEYVHVWCGKLRAPADMVRENFHEPARTDMLWVYEGLTTYYTDVIAVRSGLITFEEFMDRLADRLVSLEQRSGRLWRSVEDTARAARFLRYGSDSWYDLRRGQDYYVEGAMFWLEADAIIRAGTDGKRSLDDFCRVFFAVGANQPNAQTPFDVDELLLVLTKMYPGEDWETLVYDRLERPRRTLSMAHVSAAIGYDLVYKNDPGPLQKRPSEGSSINLRTSLGIVADKDGLINAIVPDSPADDARLAYDMTIVGVNGYRFSAKRLEEAVAKAGPARPVELIVSFGEQLKTVTIPYEGGLRYPRLELRDGAMDILRAIAEPMVE